MNLTNRLNLAPPFVAAVDRLNPARNPRSGVMSATTLLRPPQMVALERQHWDEMEEDASDRVWSLFGTMGHLVLEAAGDEGTEGECSMVVTVEIDGIPRQVRVVGHYDLLIAPVLWDWKVTSVWSIMEGPKPEWIQQMNLYTHMINATSPAFPVVTELKIGCILRDWSRSRVGGDYPPSPVITLDVPLWSIEKAQAFIQQKVLEHLSLPRPCTDSERWAKPTTWAVKSAKRKSAHRVLGTEQEAIDWMRANGKGDHIEKRPGEFTRCVNYCPVSQFCQQWKETKEAA